MFCWGLVLTACIISFSPPALATNGKLAALTSDTTLSVLQDSLLFLEKTGIATSGSNLAAKTIAVAKSFLGAPYVHGTLEAGGQEQLIVNLRDLDCWTFVENSLALAKTQMEGGDFTAFKERLQLLRYWGGHLTNYGSRIHYFSGWILQAEKLGFLSDLTRDMGGIPYTKRIGYISARPAKYPKIQDRETLRAIRGAEARINAHAWFYIPKNRVKSMEHLLKEGDIILLTTVKQDLDVAHQGFAVKRNGRIHLLHASSLGKRVLISAQPLPEYMARQKGQSGIMVMRINE